LLKIKFITIIVSGLLAASVNAQYTVIGYYPDWLTEALPAEEIQFENLTHINHAFATVNAQGRFDYSMQFPYPREPNRLFRP